MWKLSITEHVHQMREGAKAAFQRVDWILSTDLRPLTRDEHGLFRTPEPRASIDLDLLRMRGGMAFLMPGVGVE